jgi:hypothetical protein
MYFMAIWSTYFKGIWYILLLFGIFYGYLLYFSQFGVLYQEKSGNPGLDASKSLKRITNNLRGYISSSLRRSNLRKTLFQCPHFLKNQCLVLLSLR